MINAMMPVLGPLARSACLTVMLGVPTLAQPADDPLQRLAPVLGSWDVEDVYRSPSGTESRERGVRTCVRILRNRYVECTTVGVNANGREREYRWLINFNTATRHYELTGIFSNVTFRIHQTIRIDSSGTLWNIRGQPYDDGGVIQWSGAQLQFSGPDQAVWTGYRNFDSTSVASWEPSSRETWRRRTP